MTDFDHILNWTLRAGSHEFPGPDGGTCINEAAIVAAGFPYRAVHSVFDMPACFSPVISEYVLTLNDAMPEGPRQRLIPFVLRLAGTADRTEVELERTQYLAMQAVNVFAAEVLDSVCLFDQAEECRAARSLLQAATATINALWRPLPPLPSHPELFTTVNAANRAATTAMSTMSTAMPWVSKSAHFMTSSAEHSGIAAASSGSWDAVIAVLDSVLEIGRRSDPIPEEQAADRFDRVRAGSPEKRGERLCLTSTAS